MAIEGNIVEGSLAADSDMRYPEGMRLVRGEGADINATPLRGRVIAESLPHQKGWPKGFLVIDCFDRAKRDIEDTPPVSTYTVDLPVKAGSIILRREAGECVSVFPAK